MYLTIHSLFGAFLGSIRFPLFRVGKKYVVGSLLGCTISEVSVLNKAHFVSIFYEYIYVFIYYFTVSVVF